MFIIPKEEPEMKDLNSYYLDVRKLLEHYQGEFGSGCVHFRSVQAEGVLFFDKDELLTSAYRKGNEQTLGRRAFNHLLDATAKENFSINVHKIEPALIYFWSNVPMAKPVYRGLSTEFTNLRGLVKNMGTVRFTGYIEVSINGTGQGGLIFFNSGKIVGGSYSWRDHEGPKADDGADRLIEETMKTGGIFHVCRISLGQRDQRAEEYSGLSTEVLTMLERLLVILEQVVDSKKKLREGFETLLKKKFVEKADRYPFLDPFAGEFEYTDRKIQFFGEGRKREVVGGVMESAKELAEDLSLSSAFSDALKPWSRKYQHELENLDIEWFG